jgi:hypothetical protein
LRFFLSVEAVLAVAGSFGVLRQPQDDTLFRMLCFWFGYRHDSTTLLLCFTLALIDALHPQQRFRISEPRP